MLLTGEDDLGFLDEEYTYEMAEDDIYERHIDDKFVCKVRGQRYRIEARENAFDELDYTFIRGSREETKPDYYIIHDYAPAYEYVRQYQNFVAKGLIRLPPPYEPVVKSQAQSGGGVYELVYALTTAFDAKYSNTHYESYQRRKNRVMREGKYEIGFTSTTQVEGLNLGLVFNPMASCSASMIREIHYNDGVLRGTYEFNGKKYDFVWVVSHGRYLVNSDIWSQFFSSTMEMTAFSLVCEHNVFGTFFDTAKPVEPRYVIPPLISVGQDTKFDVGSRSGDVPRVPGVTANIQIVNDRFLAVEYSGQVSLELSSEGDVTDVWTTEKNEFSKMIVHRTGIKMTKGLQRQSYRRAEHYTYQEVPGTAYVRYTTKTGQHIYVPNDTRVYDRFYLGVHSVLYRVRNSGVHEDNIQCDTMYYAANMCMAVGLPSVHTNMKMVFNALMRMQPQEHFNWALQSFWVMKTSFKFEFCDPSPNQDETEFLGDMGDSILAVNDSTNGKV